MIPACVMFFLGMITVFWPRPRSKSVAHAIQHLAAGILLSSIALELIPTIAAAKEKMSIVGMVVGFTLGAIVMFTLPMLLNEDDEVKGQRVEMYEATNLMSDATVCPHPPPALPITTEVGNDHVDNISSIEKPPVSTEDFTSETARTDLLCRADIAVEPCQQAQESANLLQALTAEYVSVSNPRKT
jgi:hypothetical protein